MLIIIYYYYAYYNLFFSATSTQKRCLAKASSSGGSDCQQCSLHPVQCTVTNGTCDYVTNRSDNLNRHLTTPGQCHQMPKAEWDKLQKTCDLCDLNFRSYATLFLFSER